METSLLTIEMSFMKNVVFSNSETIQREWAA